MDAPLDVNLRATVAKPFKQTRSGKTPLVGSLNLAISEGWMVSDKICSIKDRLPQKNYLPDASSRIDTCFNGHLPQSRPPK